METLRLGPLTFRWSPDGDDPDTGFLTIEAESTVVRGYSFSRFQWTQFKEAVE